PRLANPYDLGTWSGGNSSAAETERGSTPPPARRSAADQPATRPGRDRPKVRRMPDREPDRASGFEPSIGSFDPYDADDHTAVEVLFDPPQLPTPQDPFELARRTVNRSRAAARDRGLFPISAKTQARDVRDRSGRAPGYSGSRPDPRDPQGIENVLKKVLGNL